MRKFILFITIVFLITAASARIEQHEGFPVNVGNMLKARLVVQDLDGDGKLEIIAAPQNRMVKVLDYTGAHKWENIGGMVKDDDARVPLVSDMGGDGGLEVLSYGNPGWSDATFYIWDASGNNLKNISVGRYLLVSSPAITKDGIILTGAAPGVSFSTIAEATGVHAFDSQGNKLWYLELGRSVNFLAPIPLGDIDGDGINEAVILTHDINSAYPTDGKIWLIKVTRTQGTILWSMDLGGDARSAAMDDLNGDGAKEVVAVSSGGVYIFDRNGNTLYNFKLNVNRAAPAIADMDGDGVNEVVMASSDDKKIYIISNGNLKEFSSIGRVAGSLALGDIDGDGKLEISAGDINGNMYVWDNMGNVQERARVAASEVTSTVIADLERDGSMEIILGNSNGNIYVYTYPGKPRDTAPPATTDNADEEWHNSSVTVTLTAVDDNSGVADTYYTVDGSEPTRDSARGTIITLSEDGVYTIKYFSVDNAGNREAVKTAVVKIDSTPPITIDDSDNKWHNTDVTLNLTAYDSPSGTAALYYTVGGIQSVSRSTAQITFKEEGVHTVEYYSVDNAGNTESKKTALVNIDRTSPLTWDDADGEWHNTSVNVKLTVSDNLAGAQSTYYWIASGKTAWIESLFSWLSSMIGLSDTDTSQGGTVSVSEEVYSAYITTALIMQVT